MLFSNVRFDVFVFPKDTPPTVMPRMNVETNILRLRNLTKQQWENIKNIQGNLVATYLKLRYGGPDTYVLLSFVAEELAHIQWIIPAKKIQSRYSFVRDSSYFITSCFTPAKFRGNRIYPSQLQNVISSDIVSIGFWISASKTNSASLNGIRNAGGVKVGEYSHKKWFCGVFSNIKYYSDNKND